MAPSDGPAPDPVLIDTVATDAVNPVGSRDARCTSNLNIASFAVSDSGSGLGVVIDRQVRPDAVNGSQNTPLTCGFLAEQLVLLI
jgi:hypothetical protein